MAKGGKDKEGDALKLYTIFMSLLVLVMAVLWFIIDGVRKDFVAANAQLEKFMVVEGEDRDPEDQPSSIPDLAWEVDTLSKRYRRASGGGAIGRSIPASMMENVATSVKLEQTYASGERSPREGDYMTVYQKFEFTGMGGTLPTQSQLLSLLWNIESRGEGRYRVTEVSWKAADKKDNPTSPFDKIKKPQITVSLRVPVLDE